jgi:pimeloyl-ACP methyl ester carboxylesterase
MARRLQASFDHDCCDTIDQIEAPTLLFHGSEDPLLTLPQAEWMAARIPNVEFVVFEGLRHAIEFQQPAEVAHLVRNFVLKHPVLKHPAAG